MWTDHRLPAAGRARRARFLVAQEQVVFHPDALDRPADAGAAGAAERVLVLDEEPLATVVVQVVLAEDQVVAGPDRLQAVGVVAVLPDPGELVAFDQQADAVAVSVVVAVGADPVLAVGALELVADDLHVIAGGRVRVAGVDPEVPAGDLVVLDRDLLRPLLDLDFVGGVEVGDGQAGAGDVGAVDRGRARVGRAQGHAGARLRPGQVDLAVGAVGEADDGAGGGRADRALGGADAGHRAGAGGRGRRRSAAG